MYVTRACHCRNDFLNHAVPKMDRARERFNGRHVSTTSSFLIERSKMPVSCHGVLKGALSGVFRVRILKVGRQPCALEGHGLEGGKDPRESVRIAHEGAFISLLFEF
jgi:hypothetical protein